MKLFKELKEQGHQQVIFCGVDEVAEIAYLSLREVGMELAMVIDMVPDGDFFGHAVQPLDAVVDFGGTVVLTSLKRCGLLRKELLELGLSVDAIRGFGQG